MLLAIVAWSVFINAQYTLSKTDNVTIYYTGVLRKEKHKIGSHVLYRRTTCTREDHLPSQVRLTIGPAVSLGLNSAYARRV